jgi:hypothetical protein
MPELHTANESERKAIKNRSQSRETFRNENVWRVLRLRSEAMEKSVRVFFFLFIGFYGSNV